MVDGFISLISTYTCTYIWCTISHYIYANTYICYILYTDKHKIENERERERKKKGNMYVYIKI